MVRFPSLLILASLLVACESSDKPRSSNDVKPSSTFPTSFGCGHFTITGRNSEKNQELVVTLNRAKLGLNSGTREFDLSQSTDGLSVYVNIADVSSGKEVRFETCSDVSIGNSAPLVKWTVTAGKLKVTIPENAPAPEPTKEQVYAVTVEITNIQLRDPTGKKSATVEKVEFKDVAVGFING